MIEERAFERHKNKISGACARRSTKNAPGRPTPDAGAPDFSCRDGFTLTRRGYL
jgi:hypothetical protein